ncbi:hypothetical protein DID88_009879 [Monilinia fructigena]|uniref:Uncharacterized protein n=1 Tax=Monilinia fructigena TaxID=38457 RepID=A0A395ILN0_9HELO|nr:hypothetical protein DID88_009879 [Monilinia fructigena]
MTRKLTQSPERRDAITFFYFSIREANRLVSTCVIKKTGIERIPAAMEENFKQNTKAKFMSAKSSRKSVRNVARNAMKTDKNIRSVWDEKDTYYENISEDEDEAWSAPRRLRGQKTKRAPKMGRN